MINYYIVLVKGKNVRRFLNKLFKLDINIIDVKYDKNQVKFKVSYDDYLKIKKIKSIYDVNIIGVSGVKRINVLIKKYNVFIIFFIGGILLLLILSNLVLFIDINHPKEEIRNLVKNELNKNGLVLFSWGKNFLELENIKDNIKFEHRDKIYWLDIKRNGVRYDISVIERVLKDNKDIKRYSNIVANRSGFIRDLYISRGDILKNKGDYVNKGDIIVSGVIKRKDDVVKLVDASGDVYAEVWYKVKISHPFNYKIRTYDNKGKRSFIISLFNNNIKLFSYNKKNIINREKCIFNSPVIKLNIKDQLYYKDIIKKYNSDELLLKIENMAKDEIKSKLKLKEKILMQKTLKKEVYNGKMYVEVFFKVYQNIASNKDVNLNEMINDN